MSHCDSRASLPVLELGRPRVVMIGQPNTGKSVLFNRITGAAAHVGNWPGITVDLFTTTVDMNGEAVEFIDLPGIYDLEGYSDDEKVVADFLSTHPVDLVVIVVNAAQIDRQILTPLQVKAMGLPAVVMLNMADEARRHEVAIDPDALAARLGMPVFLISAKYGEGCPAAFAAVRERIAARGVAPVHADLERMRRTLISSDTLAEMLDGAVTFPAVPPRTRSDRVDEVLLHPVLGLPLFFLTMFAVFSLIWQVGLPAQGLMGSVTDAIQTELLAPVLSLAPAFVQDFLLDGVWLGVATVASFVPLLVLFFLCMAAVEDSGYMARAAYLMDALMRRVGLDGRGFVMQMMGFGCNVPALMGTRVMRSRPLRLLTMLIIPFSLCSARLAVFVFIIAATFPARFGPLAMFSLYVISFVAAFLAAAVFSRSAHFRSEEPFVLELPPYRVPTLRQIVLRGWGEVREFLRRATNFIILGCVAVWFLTNLPLGATGLDTIGGRIGEALQPVMAPAGIDPHLTLALLFGFVAKEVVIGSLATIYNLSGDAVAQQIHLTVTAVQAYSFCLFCLLYTPCLTTVATIRAESKSWRFTIFSLVVSLVYAWAVSVLFYQGARALGFA